MVCTALGHAVFPVGLATVDAAEPTARASTNSVPQNEKGPEWLKQQVRVTVETNAPPARATSDEISPKEKFFDWNASWQGWDGLQLQLSKKTFLGRLPTGVTEAEQGAPPWFAGPSPSQTNHSLLYLEKRQMTARVGVKLAVDAAAYVTTGGYPPIDNGVEVRRVRVYAKGDCIVLMPVSYELEVGHGSDQFYIENSYVAFRGIPWIGELKVGQYQAPMGLDLVTSGRDITFMEPAAPLQALAPGVNAGMQMGQPLFDQRVTWRLGFFTAGGGGQDFGDAAEDYGRAIARITGLPIYRTNPDRPDSTTLLHLGLSANILYSSSEGLNYRSRPESHLAPHVVDTGNMTANSALVAGAEVAWVQGRFSVQGEYLHSWVHEESGQSPEFDGLYATASWFLTGESRPYDRKEGCFARVIPRHNFDWGKGGWGAWEIAARYSFLNLNSADVNGGRLSELMLGLNWYLHPHVKWRFNYGLARVTSVQPEGNINLFQTRLEVDF